MRRRVTSMGNGADCRQIKLERSKTANLKIAQVSPVGIPLVMHLIPAAAAGIMEV